MVVALRRTRRPHRRRPQRARVRRRPAADLQPRRDHHVDVGRRAPAPQLDRAAPAAARTRGGRRRRRDRRCRRHAAARRWRGRPVGSGRLGRRDALVVARVRAHAAVGRRHPAAHDGRLAAHRRVARDRARRHRGRRDAAGPRRRGSPRLRLRHRHRDRRRLRRVVLGTRAPPRIGRRDRGPAEPRDRRRARGGARGRALRPRADGGARARDDRRRARRRARRGYSARSTAATSEANRALRGRSSRSTARPSESARGTCQFGYSLSVPG